MKYDVWSRQEILRVSTIPKWELVVSDSVFPLSVCVRVFMNCFLISSFRVCRRILFFSETGKDETPGHATTWKHRDTAVQLHIGRRDIFTPHCGGVGFLSLIPKVRRDVCDIVRSGGLLPCVDSFHGVTQIYWVIAANPRDVEKYEIWFECKKCNVFVKCSFALK